MMVFRAGIHKLIVRIANREENNQKLVWFCAFCVGRQLKFEILKHLQYLVVVYRLIDILDK